MNVMTEELKFADLFPEEAGKLAQRLHIKKDEIPFLRKSYISEKSEVQPKERAVISYISTITKDRDGEQLLPDGVQLDNYRKNPVVLWGHRYDTMPIGKNLWIKQDEKGLIAKTVFASNEKADEVYRAYTEDIGGTGPLLRAFSVGFIPVEWEDTEVKELEKNKDLPKRIYKKWELLEYSTVPIPSCPEALTLAIEKGLVPESMKKALDKYLEVEDFQEEVEVEVGVKTMTPDELKEHYRGLREVELVSEEDDSATVEIEVETEKDVVTKPETTDDYHRIPVSEGHDGHKIRTITVSAKKKIKALYCVDCKKIKTYLFDTSAWTMEEARVWVDSNKGYSPKYKERWNKSLSKLFDVDSVEAPPATFNYALFEKFLECRVKEIFQNTFAIPSPLVGTYLAGFKELFGKFKLLDTRSFNYDGGEVPPDREVVQLNSTKSDDFLIDGVDFYDADGTPMAVKFTPSWRGLAVSIVTSTKHREWNKELLEKVHEWVGENNYLKGEKFALNGEFLSDSIEDWEGLILEEKFKDATQKSINLLEKRGEKTAHRGLLFIGPPGTGKTKTGRVIMSNSDATFIWVSSKDFSRIGPLQGISLAFSLARDLAPTVLFIEDIDNWLRDYGGDSIVVDLVKTEMDGLRQNKGVITILTSNYPEKLPDALLDRPGRFHHIINFELPKSGQREDMLKLWADGIEDKLLADIVEKTEGFSGAHIKELVDFAKIIAEEEGVSIGKALLLSLEKLMEQRDLINDIRENKKNITPVLKGLFGKEVIIEVENEGESDGDVEDLALEDTKAKEEFKCGCPECGHKLTTTEHCKDVKCPECGSTMRREERPGPGKEGLSIEDKLTAKIEILDLPEIQEILGSLKDQVAELKEGRVLSRKNREVVKNAVTALMDVLKADSTGSREDEDKEEVEDEKEVEAVVEKSEYSYAEVQAMVNKAIKKAVSEMDVGKSISTSLKKLQGKVE